MRQRRDRCPAVSRPWPADDGGLVRLRLIGGRVTGDALRALAALSQEYADGTVHLTSRANLQVRGLPLVDGALPIDVDAALRATGLVPSATHELARNVMVSPLSGMIGGLADLHPLAQEYDARLCADARLAELPGRFLVVLDDGRGDLVSRPCDLGVLAMGDDTVRLRAGEQFGGVVPMAEGAAALIDLAHRFLAERGAGPSAAWHVAELDAPLLDPHDPGLLPQADPPPFGDLGAVRHVPVPDGLLTPELIEGLTSQRSSQLIITPWHSLLIAPEGTSL